LTGTAAPRGAGGPQVLRWTFPERAPWGRPDSRAGVGARAMVRTFGAGRTWVCGGHAPPRPGPRSGSGRRGLLAGDPAPDLLAERLFLASELVPSGVVAGCPAPS